MKTFILFLFLFSSLYADHKYTNSLVDEDSPYLRQHAHNPVDWYAWGEEALALAKEQNKLIFLSIGYSTCHWCHVMEEESFESEAVAQLLGRNYIAIKVDREELPQIDKKYQQLFKAINGRSGGWPLNVFLTKDLEAFYVATYIPKEQGYGSKGMLEILPYYAKSYKDNPKKIAKQIEAYKKITQRVNRSKESPVSISQALIDQSVDEVVEEYDSLHGGFASRPKFPEASKIALLLDIYAITDSNQSFKMAQETLSKMAKSGLYDQIDGGFFRYTTDRRWQIPHFEKMLYTNAELIPQYVRLYQIDSNPLYLKVIQETIAEMDRRFLQGSVYGSASDADSDGEEGGYFIYDYHKVYEGLEKLDLKAQEIEEALAYLGIEEDGNIDGDLSHIHITRDQKSMKLKEVKAYLKELRKERNYPFTDTKIITAWNAMMIKALFAVGRVESSYIKLAEKRLDALLLSMSAGGELFHQVLYASKPTQKGLLEDYAFVLDMLIEADQVTHDKHYLQQADILAKRALELFYRDGRWYLSADGLKVVADSDDKYYTAPMSVMLSSLLSLAVLTENLKMGGVVRQSLDSMGEVLVQKPSASPQLMSVLLRSQIGDVVIKASKTNLKINKEKIRDIQYPFILTKEQNISEFLACKINSCFAQSKTLDGLIERVERERVLPKQIAKKVWK